MEKFTAFIEKHIAPLANKLGRNKYVVALQNSFFAMIPFITVGALALVLISPPADYTTMDPGSAGIDAGMAGICRFYRSNL